MHMLNLQPPVFSFKNKSLERRKRAIEMKQLLVISKSNFV